MDMQIKHKLIKQWRLAKAWSQSDLAAASGLSLRTIQRLEQGGGSASMETTKALAAVFDTSINQLVTSKAQRFKLWLAPTLTVAVLAGLLVIPAAADPVMLAVKLQNNEETLADVHLLNKENLISEMMVGDDLKLTFSASMADDNAVKITVGIYESKDNELMLIGQPEIITQNRKPGEITFNGKKLTITPDAN